MQVVFRHFGVASIVMVVSLVSCGPDTYTLELNLTLYGEVGYSIEQVGGIACNGIEGYEDISEGQQVRVLDGSGNVIGVSKWAKGALVNVPSFGQDSCSFYTLIELPRADVYQIEGRGNYTVTFDELKESDWELFLALGEER